MHKQAIPYVKGGLLHTPGGAPICAVGERTGWSDWLEGHTSFRYISGSGATCTLIRELRAGRSGIRRAYWYAHRHMLGKLRRVYLGKAERLTLVRLEAAAVQLAQLELDDAGHGQ
jgi:hypothetical protein